jgi:hypothetical protein
VLFLEIYICFKGSGTITRHEVQLPKRMNPPKQLHRPNQQKQRTPPSHGPLRPTPVGPPSPTPVGPPRPTPVDIIIGQHSGSTVALEATQEYLQASKNKPVPTLEQRIEELSAENGRLRHEMLYFQHMHDPMEEFQKEVRRGLEIIQNAVEYLEKIQQQLNIERSHK